MGAHRRSALVAANGYAALFRGETTNAALAAGMRLHTMVEYNVALIEAKAKAGRRGR